MGWNGSDKVVERAASSFKKKESPKSTRKLRVVLSVLLPIVVCIVAGYFYFCNSEDHTEKSAEKRAKPKVTKPIIKPNTKVDLPKEAASNSVVKVEPKVGPDYYEGRKIVSAVTNATGYATIITVGEDGRKKRHIVSPPPIFERATDEVIMVALMTPENQEIPPLPDLGGKRADDEFRASLKTPITILPTDSAKVRAYKEAVKSARKEILERLDEGEHFTDIIQDHCKLKNENGAIRIEAIAELRQIEKKHGKAEAIKYRDQMNDAFSRMGISPIELSEQSIDNQQE